MGGIYSDETSIEINGYDDCLAFCRDVDPKCDYFNFKEENSAYVCVTFSGTCPDVR